MKFSKFFLKNFSFFKYKPFKKIFFIKSKSGNHPFRQILNTTALICFNNKNNLFNNVIIYKNFDIFNKPYYSFISRQTLKGLY